MTVYEEKPPRRRFWTLLVALIILLFAVAAYFARNELNRRRLQHCIDANAYEKCIALGKTLQQRGQLKAETKPRLVEAIRRAAEAKQGAEATRFAQEMSQTFPELPELAALLQQEELRELQAALQSRSEAAYDRCRALSEKYPQSGAVQFALGEMIATAPTPRYEDAVGYLAAAIKLDNSYTQREIVVETLKKALAELPRAKADTTYALIETYYLEAFAPILKEKIFDKGNALLRNNSYRILLTAEQITPEESFQHHWLNLLSSTSETQEDFNDATTYFQKLQTPPQPLDYSYFPNLDKVPDYFLHEAMKLLMDIFTQPTQALLIGYLKDSGNDWRRVNSFYALNERGMLNKEQIQRYHATNLGLKDYAFFTDWLVDSIDYYGNLGESGRARLMQFVQKIVDLNKRAIAKGDKEHSAAYMQIEAYTRRKIGKKN